MLTLAACESTSVGTGWSRAPDMSVYAALDMAGDVAREQEILCLGRSPAEVDADFATEFGARRDWIAAALAARYGSEAVAAAERRVGPREPCATIMIDRPWHRSYARLLKQLELRLYPKDYWDIG